jgi:16S rRNA (cytosine967-C5)-methyltransferase
VIQVQLQATHILLQVLGGRSLSAALPESRAQLAAASDGAAVQDIAYGVLRQLGLLRAVLHELTEGRVEDQDLEALLLVALYQLEFTRAAQHAVVDHAVRACAALRKASAKGLVNAVLRNFVRRRQSLLDHARDTDIGRWSYPQWWIDALRRAYPQQYAEVLDAGNMRPPMTLRINARQTDTSAYNRLLEREGLQAQQIGPTALLLEHPVPVDRLPGFSEGLVSVQDLAAQYAAPCLDLKRGQRVLDACAAPGGKTAHICEYADVDVTAVEVDATRLKRVAQSLERLRLYAKLVHADARELDSWWDATPFDRILLDAPCTASGIVRRHPDIKWLRRSTDIDTLAGLQCELLASLWRALAPGGKLLYATCSVFPEETHQQLSAFLQAHPDAARVELPVIAQIEHTKGQLLPHSRHDGFFYALLQKS